MGLLRVILFTPPLELTVGYALRGSLLSVLSLSAAVAAVDTAMPLAEVGLAATCVM